MMNAEELPDKAVSVLDTACARVALGLEDEEPAERQERRDLVALGAQDDSEGVVRVGPLGGQRGGGLVFTAPKTARSKRTIPLPKQLADALAVHKDQQDKEHRFVILYLDYIHQDHIIYKKINL